MPDRDPEGSPSSKSRICRSSQQGSRKRRLSWRAPENMKTRMTSGWELILHIAHLSNKEFSGSQFFVKIVKIVSSMTDASKKLKMSNTTTEKVYDIESAFRLEKPLQMTEYISPRMGEVVQKTMEDSDHHHPRCSFIRICALIKRWFSPRLFWRRGRAANSDMPNVPQANGNVASPAKDSAKNVEELLHRLSLDSGAASSGVEYLAKEVQNRIRPIHRPLISSLAEIQDNIRHCIYCVQCQRSRADKFDPTGVQDLDGKVFPGMSSMARKNGEELCDSHTCAVASEQTTCHDKGLVHVKKLFLQILDCWWRRIVLLGLPPVRDDTPAGKLGERNSKTEERSSKVEEQKWDLLPTDIHGYILRKLNYESLAQLKPVSRGMKEYIESTTFVSSRGDGDSNEGSLTSLYLYIKDGAFNWSGFDIDNNKWRSLPTLRCLPSPGPSLFKEYLVSSGGGLLCANISKSLEKEELVVCNPMTHSSSVIPPLISPRNPVLLHMLVNSKRNSFKIIVAGSSGMAEGHLSKKTEVFDSRTSQWEVTGDLPGLDFGLNEYQTGVCINGILYCIAFLEDGSRKGVLAYDVEEGVWKSNWKCPLPVAGHAESVSIAQLAECDGEVYLFLEIETGRNVEQRIEKLEITSGGTCRWKSVVREQKSGGRGLLVYPEYACVKFGVGRLCIFNTIERTGKVYDMRKGGESEPLPLPQRKGGEIFHSLNPLSFTFEPNFKSVVEEYIRPGS